MDDKLGPNRKPRVSKGKLKRPTNKKCKRKSQGFSPSFTQKTLNNNIYLAQSLAKEKSRNEKLITLHRELMATRNEALMRLNETEASFDRLGQLVQNGIKQLHEVATTMGDLFNEIRVCKNNPRDSASMRSSFDPTYATRVSATASGSRVQVINSRVNYTQTQPKINYSPFDGMEEDTEDNAQSPTWPVLGTPQPVSPIEEESDTTNSDIDGTGSGTSETDDEVRDDSLLCRRTPRQKTWDQPSIQFSKPSRAQDEKAGPSARTVSRAVRKVPRTVSRPPSRNVVDTSSPIEECDIHNRTSCSIVDMDETVLHNKVPITRNEMPEEIIVDNSSNGLSLSFHTVTQGVHKPTDDPSYKEMFFISKKDASLRLSKTIGATDLRHTGLNGNCVTSPSVNVTNSNHRSSTNKRDFSPESLDFGCSPTSPEKILQTKTSGKRLGSNSPNGLILPNLAAQSISPDKFYNNKTSNHAHKPSKSTSGFLVNSKQSTVESPSTSTKYQNENDLDPSSHVSNDAVPDLELLKVTKNIYLRVYEGSSKAKQSPTVSKSKSRQQINNVKQSKPERASESPKLPKAKANSTFTNKDEETSRLKKSQGKTLRTVTSLGNLPTPTLRTSLQADMSSKTINLDKNSTRSTRSSSLLPSKSLPKKPRQLSVESETLADDLPTQLGLIRVSHSPRSNNYGASHFASRVSSLTNGSLNTPNRLPVVGPHLETKSANEPRRELLVKLERLPAISKSADIANSAKNRKKGRLRLNTNNDDGYRPSVRSLKGLKRSAPLPTELNDTPSRGSKANTPNVVVLVEKMNDDIPISAKNRRNCRPGRNTSSEEDYQLLKGLKLKRSAPLPMELHDTPPCGRKANTPNPVVLVEKMDDDNSSIVSVDSEQEHTERRARRKVAPTNLKERSLSTKIRRPTPN